MSTLDSARDTAERRLRDLPSDVQQDIRDYIDALARHALDEYRKGYRHGVDPRHGNY